jgi:hypothetical protein
MLTDEQKADIRFLIAYYDHRGADWSNALEYQVRTYNGSLPHQERWPWGGRRRKAKQTGEGKDAA